MFSTHLHAEKSSTRRNVLFGKVFLSLRLECHFVSLKSIVETGGDEDLRLDNNLRRHSYQSGR